MSGHGAKRRRRWPWAILSLLFALAFAWSFAVVGERVEDVWNVLRIVSAVGLGISLLLLVRGFVSSRRLRRAQKDDGRRAEGDEEAAGRRGPDGGRGRRPGHERQQRRRDRAEGQPRSPVRVGRLPHHHAFPAGVTPSGSPSVSSPSAWAGSSPTSSTPAWPTRPRSSRWPRPSTAVRSSMRPT